MSRESSEAILQKLQHRGYTVVDPEAVSTEWLEQNNVLACRGQMFWYLLQNTREHRVVQKRWEKEREQRIR